MSASVQDAPDVELPGVVHIEDQIRRLLDRPAAQPGDAQQVRVAPRADGRMRREGAQCVFEQLRKLAGQAWSTFGTQVREDCVDVRLCERSESQRSLCHAGRSLGDVAGGLCP